ncbi:MAG: hypothetical protein KatS3mg104_3069 [Phycisphaerae bacterium]|nr:MAG: hypothetical protein KatS3mg104_3069 [Phycisphaerae bacterium]
MSDKIEIKTDNPIKVAEKITGDIIDIKTIHLPINRRRTAVCQSCQHFKGHNENQTIVSCELSFRENKTVFTNEGSGECPLNKWRLIKVKNAPPPEQLPDKKNIDNKTPVEKQNNKPTKTKLLKQPGDILHYIFGMLGFQPEQGCSCKSMQSLMNQWGWRGCIKNIRTILKHVQREAAKRQQSPNLSKIQKILIKALLSKRV